MGGAAHDSYVLTSPQGSSYDLASWVRVEEGPDFGDSWMVARYAESPAADGGQFAFESAGVRTMRFPLLMASSGAALGIDLLENENQLRLAARPGATIDIEVANDNHANAIRFDVLSGRWKPDYKVREEAISIRQGWLEVDVDTFGYMPTDIILASAASVGLPGKLSISGQIGDVPGFGVLTVTPTVPTGYAGGSWYPDLIAWSLHGQGASFQSLWSAGSIATGALPGSQITDAFAIGGQGWEVVGRTAWAILGGLAISPTIEAAYRGRHRVWALAKLQPSQGLPWYISADVAVGSNAADWVNSPLASAAPIASLPPAIASGGASGGAWASASPNYTLLDLGEISLPPIASGRAQAYGIRISGGSPTSPVPVPTPLIRMDSVWLQTLPIAGVMPRGIKFTPSDGYLVGRTTDSLGFQLSSDPAQAVIFRSDASQSAIRDGAANYRGVGPMVGASVTNLEVAAVSRRVAVDTPAARSAPAFAAVSLTYRPRFAFIRGL